MNHTTPVNLASPWTWAIPLASIIGMVAVSLTGSNESLFLLFNSLSQSTAGAVFWSNITVLGDALLAFALISLLARHRPDVVWALIIAAIIATFWVHGAKYFFGHPRPSAVLSADAINIIGVNLRGGSFPSGHTTSAFVLAGVLCHLRIHTLLSWLAVTLATLAGFSRAAVGAHWPMDIFAGAFSGWIIALLGVMLFKQLTKRKQWGTRIPGQLVFHIGFLLIAISLFFYNNGYPNSLPFQYTVAIISIIVIVFNLSQMLFTKSYGRTSTGKNQQD